VTRVAYGTGISSGTSNMGLCAACLSVPFTSLPEHLEQDGFHRIGDHSDLPALFLKQPIDADRDKGIPAESLGFRWHDNIGALASSAQSCPLCAVVHEGVEQWMQRREIAMQQKFYVVFQETYAAPVPTENALFLAQRAGAAPGFLVYVKCANRDHEVYLLTGVAFSVAASKPFENRHEGYLSSLHLIDVNDR
jgi:hypothetical protein